MSGLMRVACVAGVCAVVGLFAATASADLLDAGTAYVSGGTTWRGSTDIVSTNPDLTGTVDYAVYGPGAFPFGSSSTFTPNNSLYTYVYQVHCTGRDDISNYTVDMQNLGGNIGWFGAAPLIAPSYAELDSPNYASWDFAGNFLQYTSSAALAFSSPYAPEFLTSSVVDGGTFGFVIPVPSPGSQPIPEPGTFLLLAVAIGMAAGVKRFWNCKR
jgi:hypothetical protein